MRCCQDVCTVCCVYVKCSKVRGGIETLWRINCQWIEQMVVQVEYKWYTVWVSSDWTHCLMRCKGGKINSTQPTLNPNSNPNPNLNLNLDLNPNLSTSTSTHHCIIKWSLQKKIYLIFWEKPVCTRPSPWVTVVGKMYHLGINILWYVQVSTRWSPTHNKSCMD